MSIPDFQFDPPTGHNNADVFPDYPARDQVRPLIQRLFDQTRDFINNSIKTPFNTHLAETAKKTTQNILYYVSTTGNDANDGLTPETAFRTIQNAINSLPQIINHTVDINLAPGTYNEEVTVSGFIGKNMITIRGASNLADSANYIINGITMSSCSIRVDVIGFRATRINLPAFFAFACSHVRIVYCSVISNSVSSSGIQINTGTMAMISECLSSNRLEGIRSGGGVIASLNTSGTGNGTALYADLGGVIAKDGTQPTGTVNETTHSGGVIR